MSDYITDDQLSAINIAISELSDKVQSGHNVDYAKEIDNVIGHLVDIRKKALKSRESKTKREVLKRANQIVLKQTNPLLSGK